MRTMVAAAMAAAMTCALMFGAPTAGAVVTTPTSGWFWGDPRPQGDNILDLAFAGNRGYAIGEFGTALRSDDGGATWTGLRPGVNTTLTAISVPSPDTVFLSGGCSVRRSTDGGATFRRVRFSSSDSSCRSNPVALAFLSADLGYIAAVDGTVQFTSDGGQSFSGRTAVPGTRATGGSASPVAMAFLSGTNGFVATSGGQIFQTLDAGNSWTPRASFPGLLRDIAFADANTGYAVGDNSRLLVTGDGGATWNPAAASGVPAGLPLNDISCASASVCVAVELGRSSILRTSDGWATGQESSPSTFGLTAAAFAAGSRVVVAGQAGTTRISDDSGATFAAVGGALGLEVNRLRPGAGSLAYAPATHGLIGVTGDGGQTWGALTANTSDPVVDVGFPTSAVGYAVDSGGLVLKTVNGGSSWTQLDAGAGHTRALLAPNTSTVVLVGTGIRRSDNGETFTRLSGLAGRAALLDADQGGSALFAWGRGTILASTNGGRSWTKLRKPAPRLSIRDLDFVSPNLGFLLDTAGRLYRTLNRGKRWTELVSLGTDRGDQLSFNNGSAGFVAGDGIDAGANDGVVVWRTSDGGRSFAPQLVDDGDKGLLSVLATGPSSGLLADNNEKAEEAGALGSSLFGTTNGGQAGSASAITLTATPRKRTRAGNVVIRGRLRPAEGGEIVTVSRFDLKAGRWASRRVTVASNGAFSTTWRISRTAAFVAAWRGDDDRAGDGSPALTVRVGR